jgi:hypothetical protein
MWSLTKGVKRVDSDAAEAIDYVLAVLSQVMMINSSPRREDECVEWIVTPLHHHDHEQQHRLR